METPGQVISSELACAASTDLANTSLRAVREVLVSESLELDAKESESRDSFLQLVLSRCVKMAASFLVFWPVPKKRPKSET